MIFGKTLHSYLPFDSIQRHKPILFVLIFVFQICLRRSVMMSTWLVNDHGYWLSRSAPAYSSITPPSSLPGHILKVKVILSDEQLTLLRLRGNKVDLENVCGGCEPLWDDQPRQGDLCDEWSQLFLLIEGQELEHYKKKLNPKPFLILPPPLYSRCSQTHSGFSFPVLAPCPSCWRTSWWARSGNKKSVLQLHYMTCRYLWEFLFSGSPFCLFTGGSHKYAGVVHWEVVITVLLAPSLLSLVMAPSEMSPWEQTLSKVLVFEEVCERRVPSLAEPKGGRGVLPAARRDRSIVTVNVCVVVSTEQHLVIIRETSLCFGGLKTPVHLLSICKYVIMRYEQFLLRLV